MTIATVTLAEVATRAGVSKATASRVLNNKMVMPIPETTIERIKRAAEELGYRPNALARALATRRTHTLGIYTREMTDPHFAQMLEAVEAKARGMSYHVVVGGELEGIAGEGRVDGVLMLASPREAQFAPLLRDTVSVFVWSESQPTPNCVSWNDIEGAYQAGQYLLRLGHRRVAGLFGDYPPEEPPYPKVLGFRKAMQEGGAQWQEYQKKLSPDQFDNGYLLTQELLRASERATAIFARNDFLAIGALKALREAGIAVPQEMSVVGYNDTVLARYTDPALTSVRTPIAQAGEIAVERLVKAIETKESEFPGTVLPTSLTLRDSCAPPPQ